MRRIRAYFERVSLQQLLWRDMLLFGTAANVFATLLALALFAARAPTALAAAVHFLPLPLNVCLCLLVWRRASGGAPPAAAFARTVSVVWLVLVVIL